MAAAVFSAQIVNNSRSAVEGSNQLPDGSELIWAMSRREFGPMSFNNRPQWDVAHNRMQFLRLFNLKIDRVVSPQLQHGSEVVRVSAADAGHGARELRTGPANADGLVTNDPNTILLTTHADCPPLWLCAPKGGWIGLAHTGWRGLLGGIVQNLVRAIPERDRDDLVLSVGPGICSEHYPVGKDVAYLFLDNSSLAGAVKQVGGTYSLDLVKGIQLAAGEEGVVVRLDSWACTFEGDFMSSHRRDGSIFSPMGAVITRVEI